MLTGNENKIKKKAQLSELKMKAAGHLKKNKLILEKSNGKKN